MSLLANFHHILQIFREHTSSSNRISLLKIYQTGFSNTFVVLHIYLFSSVKTKHLPINLGAVESRREHNCTPLQLLDCKEFCSGYWKWCHLFLIDAVRQYGYPSLFITISPSEWTFPQVCL